MPYIIIYLSPFDINMLIYVNLFIYRGKHAGALRLRRREGIYGEREREMEREREIEIDR